MLKVQTGERSPLWCTLLVFTRSGGQRLMPTIIVHQAKEYCQDLQFNIPLDWGAHHTAYGYMDKCGWLQAMDQFSNVCGNHPVKNKTIFFNGHDSHFDDRALRQTECQNIEPFVLKTGDSTNDHPNYNGPNAKLKSLYNKVKSTWMLKYGTEFFYLTTQTPYRWNHGTHSRCQLATLSGTYLLKQPPPHPSDLPT